MAALSFASSAGAKVSAMPRPATARVALKPSAPCVGVMFGKMSLSDKKLSVTNGAKVVMKGAAKSTTFNVQVYPGESEPAESALRRFRRAVMSAGVIPEVRRRRYFENSQDIKKRKAADARRKSRGRQNRTRTYAQALEPDTRGNRFNRDGPRRDGPPRDGPPREQQQAPPPESSEAAPVEAAAE